MKLDQIRFELSIRNLNFNDIARTAGVHRSFITNIFKGRDKPSERIIEAFKKHGIDLKEGDPNE